MSTASVSVLPDWEIADDFEAPKFIEKPQFTKVLDGQPASFTAKVIYFMWARLFFVFFFQSSRRFYSIKIIYPYR